MEVLGGLGRGEQRGKIGKSLRNLGSKDPSKEVGMVATYYKLIYWDSVLHSTLEYLVDGTVGQKIYLPSVSEP